jgi:hypothetical protein
MHLYGAPVARIRSFWHGGGLSPYEALCLASFIHHGHQVELFTYAGVPEAPPGVVLRDAAEILPADRVFVYAQGTGRGSVAGFANLFRYALLAREPGWWVDTDVLCLSPDLPEQGAVFAWEEPARSLVGNAVLRLPDGDKLPGMLLAAREAFGPDRPWGTAGPLLLTRLLREAGRLEEARPHGEYFPWYHGRAFAVLDPAATAEVEAAAAGARMQHLWNEHFRAGGLCKTVAPPEGSWLDLMFRRHGIGFPAAPRLDAALVARLAAQRELALSAAHLSAEAARAAQLAAQLATELDSLRPAAAAARQLELENTELQRQAAEAVRLDREAIALRRALREAEAIRAENVVLRAELELLRRGGLRARLARLLLATR